MCIRSVGLHQTNLRLHRVLVRNIADVHVASKYFRHDRAKEFYRGAWPYEQQFWDDQLVTFPHSAHFAMYHGPVETHPIVFTVFQDVHTLMVEVSRPPMPQGPSSIVCITNSGTGRNPTFEVEGWK